MLVQERDDVSVVEYLREVREEAHRRQLHEFIARLLKYAVQLFEEGGGMTDLQLSFLQARASVVCPNAGYRHIAEIRRALRRMS